MRLALAPELAVTLVFMGVPFVASLRHNGVGSERGAGGGPDSEAGGGWVGVRESGSP
ncbi:hypothetical protein GCM10023329_10950 [Streptomyces sanyensis]|uniref:Uncharacterized protein n=1 Tax=Streptomyces sanyensis TaxID=568869 RepID=A0ABP8ZUI2_9ACTN